MDERDNTSILVTMKQARRMYRDPITHVAQGVSFRRWARGLFDPADCTGKLRKICDGPLLPGRAKG